MICSKCGATIPDNSNYCRECGTMLSETIESTSAIVDTPTATTGEVSKGKYNEKIIVIAAIALAVILILMAIIGSNKKNKADISTTTGTTVSEIENATEASIEQPSSISSSGIVIEADNLTQKREFNCTVDEYISNFNDKHVYYNISKSDFESINGYDSSYLSIADYYIDYYILVFKYDTGESTLTLGVNPADDHIAYISYDIDFYEYPYGFSYDLSKAVFSSLNIDSYRSEIIGSGDNQFRTQYFKDDDLLVDLCLDTKYNSIAFIQMRPMTELLFNRLDKVGYYNDYNYGSTKQWW